MSSPYELVLTDLPEIPVFTTISNGMVRCQECIFYDTDRHATIYNTFMKCGIENFRIHSPLNRYCMPKAYLLSHTLTGEILSVPEIEALYRQHKEEHGEH